MNTLVTDGVLDSLCECAHKAFLQLAGHTGTIHEFERLQLEKTAMVAEAAKQRILANSRRDEVLQRVALTSAVLKPGKQFLLDVTLRTRELNLRFDGLKLVSSDSACAKAHYMPILFTPHESIRKKHRSLLALYALLIGEFQRCEVNSGLLFYGSECRSRTIRLGKYLPEASRVLKQLRELLSATEPPQLILNNHCSVCEYRQRCREQATKDDNLSLMRGVGEREVRRYSRKGILTIKQLAHTFRPRRKGKRAGLVNRRYHSLQAMAIRDKTVYVLGVPEMPTTPVNIFVDIESDPETNFIYLVGAIVDTGDSQKSYSFWADDPSQEKQICNAFLDMIASYRDFTLFAYGAYEKKWFTKMRTKITPRRRIGAIMQRLVNTLSLIYSHVYFPVYSNGLKDIGRHLGCSWSESDASGLQSVVWRMNWEATRDPMWKERIITYNLEDCSALKKVTEFIATLREQERPEADDSTGERVAVTWVSDLDTLVQPKKWGPVNFFHSDFAVVNKCAYFDYQRERVYVRTNKTIRRDVAATRKQHRKRHNARLRVSKKVVVEARTCPNCRSRNLVRGLRHRDIDEPPPNLKRPHVKRAFDLLVYPSSIKRMVIQCRTTIHRCQDCSSTFVPWRYEHLAKHWHGLMSWVMYQHVVHRISMRAIEAMLKDFFGLQVIDTEIVQMKTLMAKYYNVAVKRLLKRMISGEVLHVDETTVKLRTGKAYVWVFANMEAAVYMYRPTREAGFLKKLLRDFKGVLVTDFYTGYDSLDCRQQRCLIHLMRDMNQELLESPFDNDLQDVTRDFGKLLRATVNSVDKHGLKKRHLRKHDRAVRNFFADLEEKVFTSDAAKNLQVRLLKNKAKLFTFVGCDGVSWNNNCAENAIKYFAYYRHNRKGALTERGIQDYLVLLSLYQTCRYRGIRFLPFMLSRHRDIETFSKPRRKRRQTNVEVYPKGFIPLFGTSPAKT